MSKWNVTYRGIIYPWHCDHMGHMNVMWYAGKFDEACWQLLAMLGLEPSRFARDGTGMAAVEQHIQYKRELHAGDAVTIQSALLEVKDKSVRMLHKMVHDASGDLAATTVVVGIHIDARLRKAIRFPEDVRQRAVKMKSGKHLPFKRFANGTQISLRERNLLTVPVNPGAELSGSWGLMEAPA